MLFSARAAVTRQHSRREALASADHSAATTSSSWGRRNVRLAPVALPPLKSARLEEEEMGPGSVLGRQNGTPWWLAVRIYVALAHVIRYRASTDWHPMHKPGRRGGTLRITSSPGLGNSLAHPRLK